MKNDYDYQSEHFLFRTIKIRDAEILVKWRSDQSVIKYFYNNFPVTMESHLNWFNNIYLQDDFRYDFIVFDDDIPVGFVALANIDINTLEAEINYTIGNSDYRGKGFGCELINSIVWIGHSLFGLKNFWAIIHKDNIASQKTALKCGFKLQNDCDVFCRYIRSLS